MCKIIDLTPLLIFTEIAVLFDFFNFSLLLFFLASSFSLLLPSTVPFQNHVTFVCWNIKLAEIIHEVLVISIEIQKFVR